ncbi:hypothetical protein CC85DRAFT_324759 [Cutaneotrichosporon oleaginosum]|uniref:Timeless N-terminal domain-containing protein n=1 Tax=Cutaneotrichosporon oleaginosum TaxID=879819 RepID=A0A0J0XZH9_9TREE|nr:uncharacterized protein CC85DRAFT_324759 [Cutaneotrichosporon oleaginosum]KLT46441.1 hypothetical protein CC85DRAFT_324759 [Cutaneotrichosporon oleaginosum]TXT15190.1 hypothetical protein COLE_01383 [Cutaneotrichosporon oleaginosum]
MSDIDLMSSPRGHSPDPGEEGEDRFDVFMPAVQNLVNALGGYERVPTDDGGWEMIYRPGDSVLAVIKDLKKLWRKDDADDDRTVARCMYKANLMQELIGLVGEVHNRGEWGRKVALMACDLVAALTWPIDVAAELKELQDEGPVVTDFASLLRAHVEYKAMILQSDTLRCVLSLMIPCFGTQRRDEKDDRIISLCLHIVRNLLAIRDVRAPDTATGEEEELSRLQSTLIVQLDSLEYLSLFITMASEADRSTGFNSYNMLLLDILHLIYRCIRPEELGKDQATASSESLAKLLADEERQKNLSKLGKATRHSRFGTTLAIRTPGQRFILHNQAAMSADPVLMLDLVKKARAPHKRRAQDELVVNTTLTTEAITVLQDFTIKFLEYFNTFFRSVVTDIRMERSKVRPSDSIRTLFVSSTLVEYLIILRRKAQSRLEESARRGRDPKAKRSSQEKAQKQQEIKEEVDAEAPLGWAAEMVDIDSLKWVTARMRIAFEDKAWTELQASVDCFTQILLVLESMSLSTNQEDVDAGNLLQNQLYYNADILDASLAVVSNFTSQSYSYLSSVVAFAYTLFRTLEKYSKSQAYMFVRKRKPARRKLPPPSSSGGDGAAIPEEYRDDEEEDMEEERDRPEFAEHKFTFEAFERKLAQESVTHTLLSYLEQYQTFENELPFKRVVGLMHRQVVKAQAEGLYFSVSTLNLFRHILKDKPKLPLCDGTSDLYRLIQFVLRQFFKRLEADPFIMVEIFLPKSRGQWKGMSSYAEEDNVHASERARVREQMGPPELEFIKKNKLSWSDQMAVAIRMLLDANHEEWVRWIISTLEIALAGRLQVVFNVDGDRLRGDDSDDDDGVRHLAGPSKEAQDKFERYDLDADTQERRKAVTTDQHLRLMLKLVGFEQTDETNNADRTWFIPESAMPDSLEASIGALKQYFLNPPTLDKDPKTLVRAVRQRQLKSPEYNSDGEVVAPAPRKRQRKDELQVYKSAAYIDDSDDEADDEAFFSREAELRAEMSALAQAAGHSMRSTGTKRKRKSNAIEPLPLGDMDMNMLEDDSDDERRVGSPSGARSDSEDVSPAKVKRLRDNFSPVSAISDTSVAKTQTQTRRRRAVADSDEDE